jgi:hypothetical protein
MIPIQKSPKREITQIGVAFTDHARIVGQNEAPPGGYVQTRLPDRCRKTSKLHTCKPT